MAYKSRTVGLEPATHGLEIHSSLYKPLVINGLCFFFGVKRQLQLVNHQ